jgi:acetylornithine/LysW-gamma-L-lysine aminotransferase
MLAMELRFEVRDIILEALTKGVILLYSGRNILRFLPPLVIEEEQVKKVLETLDEVLTEEERRRGV